MEENTTVESMRAPTAPETGSAEPIVSPVAVLDADLRLIGANREFHHAFGADTRSLDMTLERLLATAPDSMEHVRTMMQDAISSRQARQITLSPEGTQQLRTFVLVPAYAHDAAGTRSVLILEDATERTQSTRLLVERLESREMRMEEMRHRMANGFQIIASVVRIKAHLVQSDDARSHLEDIHQRVLAIAELQEQLDAADDSKTGSVAQYLSAVCVRLASSLIDPASDIEIQVDADELSVRPETCTSMGLVVTELVTNALKHAFPGRDKGTIRVSFAVRGPGWQLSVADNGVGCDIRAAVRAGGVGTRIVSTLAKRLRARLELSKSTPQGLTVTLIHSPEDPFVA